MLNLLSIHLQDILSERNIYRDYQILVGKDLFETWTTSIINGRTGRVEKLRQYSFLRLEELQKKLSRLVKKRKSSHKRIGIDYKNELKKLHAFRMGVTAPKMREEVARVILNWIHRNFRQEGGLDGTPKWPPLSRRVDVKAPKRYGDYKDKLLPGAPMLVWTGKLKGSFREKLSAVGRPPSGDTHVFVGTDVKYAKYHDREGFNDRPVIPLRQLLPRPELAKQIAQRAVSTYIQATIRKVNAQS